MNTKILAALVLTLIVWGGAGASGAADESRGKAAPVITAHFATQELRPGDTWRIYLKASDPDGDMKYIVATMDQAGMGGYSASYTRIARERGKELSGYVYLNTMASPSYTSTIFYDLHLTLQIQDRAGNYSQPIVVPLHFQYRAGVQAPPVSGGFEDQDLGPVMISLKTMTAENVKGGGMAE